MIDLGLGVTAVITLKVVSQWCRYNDVVNFGCNGAASNCVSTYSVLRTVGNITVVVVVVL